MSNTKSDEKRITTTWGEIFVIFGRCLQSPRSIDQIRKDVGNLYAGAIWFNGEVVNPNFGGVINPQEFDTMVAQFFALELIKEINSRHIALSTKGKRVYISEITVKTTRQN